MRFATPYRAPAVIDRTAQVEAAPAEPTAPTEPTAPIQATTIEVMAPKGPLGLRMRDANPGVIVEGLAETSPLAGQVTVGDVIVALDGEDTSAHSLIELFAMIRNRSDRERVLTIRRDPKPADDNTFAAWMKPISEHARCTISNACWSPRASIRAAASRRAR